MKSNPLINQITKHYLKYDKKNPFIYISILLSFFGISLGIMTLIISMGVMNGTQKELTRKLTIMKYPLTITSETPNLINNNLVRSIEKKFPHLTLSEYYTSKVVIRDGEEIDAGFLLGVNFEKEAKINSIFKESYIKSHGNFNIILGKGFSNNLGYFYGDRIELTFPKIEAVGFGGAPVRKRFTVNGIFNSGISMYDNSVMYAGHSSFQRILSRDTFDGIHIHSETPFEDIENLKSFLDDDIEVIGWWETDKALYSSLQLEKSALFLVLMLIVLVASLNIISSLLMMVITKRKDISLLLSLGATEKEIKNIFFKLGMSIGILGLIFGSILGGLGLLLLSNFELPEEIYGFSKLPIHLPLYDLGIIIAGTIVIVFISSLYPAKKASETDVLKVLRND